MTIAEMIERIAVFIYQRNGLLAERPPFVLIFHIVVTKVEVCNNIGVNH